MSVLNDIGLLDVEIAAAEDELINGEVAKGLRLISSLISRIKDEVRESEDDSMRKELEILLAKCRKMVLGASERSILRQPTPFIATSIQENVSIDSLIMLPDNQIFLEDLIGMKEVKMALLEAVVVPVMAPNLIPQNHRWKGVLLFGGSGCGKSKILAALMNTVLTKLDIKINFVHVSNADIMGNFYGDSERKLSSIFKACADMQPCIVFMDEVDSFAGKRGSSNKDTENKMINHFLSEMDGIRAGAPVVVIGTTNAPHRLDFAFLRRFEKKVYVELPNKHERKFLLQSLLGRVQSISSSCDVDFETLALMTWRYSPADMRALVTSAINQVRCRDSTEKLLEILQGSKINFSADGLFQEKTFRSLNMDDFRQAAVKIRPTNKESDLTDIEAFARDHCPRTINMDEIASDCECCTIQEIREKPFFSLLKGYSTLVECLCGSC